MRIGGADLHTALLVIPAFILARGCTQILFRKSFLSGVESHYALYLEELAKTGDLPARPWLGFLVQHAIWYIPAAFAAYFITGVFTG
jgi:hypothetical protein